MEQAAGTTEGKVAFRAKPTLITLEGGRQITSTGRWNDGLLLGYLQEHEIKYQEKIAARFYPEKLKYGWVDIGELAKVAYGQNSLDSKKKVRRSLTSLFKFALAEGVVIVVNYDVKTRRALAAKVLDPKNRDEVMVLNAKLDRLIDSYELSAEQHARVKALLAETEAA
jgi:hypothetical protein